MDAPRSAPDAPDGAPAAPRAAYVALVAGAFALAAALRNLLAHNEADVLVAALHARDPSFARGDWYLGLEIPYRDLYNLVAGSLARAVGVLPAAITGRVAGILAVALALAPLLARLRVHPAVVAPLVVLYQRHRSIVAEEWVVGSFETKTFAYAAVLGALGAAARRRWVAAAALTAVALDFHVLVGGYAAGTLALTLLVGRRDLDPPPGAGPRPRVRLAVAVGAVVAVPGAVALLRMLAASVDVDTRAAGELYVVHRVPHHTYPPSWHTPGSWLRGGATLAVLLVGARAGRRPLTRLVARYGLLSSVWAAVGLLVLAVGRVDLLKVYWFRFPDGMGPLAAMLVAGALASERLPVGRGRRAALATAASVAVVAALTGRAFARDAAAVSASTRAAPLAARALPAAVRPALLWVRDRTPADAVVLTDPFLPPPYLVMERATVVSFKCVPQTDREILAWARRLALLAGVDDLLADGGAALSRLQATGDRLPADAVARAAGRLGATHYVAAPDHVLPWRVAFEDAGARVYALGEPAGR